MVNALTITQYGQPKGTYMKKYQIQIAYRNAMSIHRKFVPLFGGRETFSTFRKALERYTELKRTTKHTGTCDVFRIVRLAN